MTSSLPLFGAGLAVLAAIVYGAGDFTGALASRRSHPLTALAMVSLTSCVLLGALAVLWGESLPSRSDLAWAGAAGLAGGVGLIAFYRGLTVGSAAVVAPTAGVVGAALPVVFVALTADLPTPLQMLGFGAALAGIWLVAGSGSKGEAVNRRGFALAVFAGAAFGAFFLLIGHVETTSPFTPLAVGKVVGFLLALLLLIGRGKPSPSAAGRSLAVLGGILDAAGNSFYFIAQHITRLDIAVVLTSLYPASTVVLAYIILREHISRRQAAGVALCLLAITLIVL